MKISTITIFFAVCGLLIVCITYVGNKNPPDLIAEEETSTMLTDERLMAEDTCIDLYTSDITDIDEPLTEEPIEHISLNVLLDDNLFEMDLEEYVVGALVAEMPIDFGIEALKAQAVAIRTYSMYKILNNVGEHNDLMADICTNYQCCMAYISREEAEKRWGGMAEKIYKTAQDAVACTNGEILTYEGEVISAVFHSSSYDYTETAENVWGYKVPYLISVPTYENDIEDTKKIGVDEFVSLLSVQLKITSEDVNTHYPIVKLNNTGRVDSVMFGNNELKSADIRSIVGLNSCNYEIFVNDRVITFITHGYGHGVGMSQYGASAMAKQGSTYDEILKHYYTGVSIEKLDDRIL